MNNIQKPKTWFDKYERVIDNVLRICWLVLLITWIIGEHKITIH